MSMSLLGYTPEEQVDFYIKIGLISPDKRQGEIDKCYDGVKRLSAEYYENCNT
ncbi:MAG: hypothetical protein NC489_21075 [Ruminococcus flavefaciens]|nr:hypothetical protein [Ruminococcus flavefaciens]